MRAVFVGLLWSVTGLLAWSQTAWLPQKGQFILTPIYTFENAGEFYFDSTLQSVFGASMEQHTTMLAAEYGLADRWALDMAIGYTSSTLKNNLGAAISNNRETIEGLADTTIGVRYQLVDEFATRSTWIPTLTLRAAAIIEGTYEANYIQSPGDGASGGQWGFLFGKSYEWLGGIGYYGGLSYRLRGENVPEDILSNVGIYKVLYKGLTANFGLRDERALGGISVTELTGALPNRRFQELEDVRTSVEGGLSYRDGGDRVYGFSIGKTVSGENTYDRTSYSVYLSVPF